MRFTDHLYVHNLGKLKKIRTHGKRLAITSLILLVASSCLSLQREDEVASNISPNVEPTNTLTPSLTPTPTETPTPSLTPTATPTSTPTPTPTPTTEPILFTGDPIGATRREAEPSGRTRCGEVDTLDFPMDPPDAARFARGGRDFGVFRSRYDKYHAGEDWWKSGGVLGEPVYSIGNGRITYAQPNGWGRDKGVIIIEHIFNDGRKVLSFYGHLDEESFEVFYGECVARGQLLAKVGNPRTPPHLHFEMRTHAPDQTLGGYWDIDPTTAGWIWPSMRIWEERVRAQKGVRWVRPFENTGIEPIGRLPSGRFAILEDSTFISVDLETGRGVEFLTFLEEPTNAAISDGKLFVTQEDDVGLIYNFKENNLLDINPIGQFPTQPARNQLIPRPGGGVVIAAQDGLTGIDANGNRLWRVELNSQLLDTVTLNETIYISTIGDNEAIWQIPWRGAPESVIDFTGKLQASGQRVWVYGETGLHYLNLNDQTPNLQTVATYDEINLGRSSLTALGNGNVLLAHVDGNDQRLIVYDTENRRTWERSLRDLGRSNFTLANLMGSPYLVSESAASASSDLSLYELDIETDQLTKILEAGTRFAYPIDSWLYPLDTDSFLVNTGGGPMTLFDPKSAE